MSDLHPNINLHCHFFVVVFCFLFCFVFFFFSFQSVSDSLWPNLVVNVAHLRKKRQATGNETAGENAFKEIVKSTKVHKSLSLTSYRQIPLYGHLIIHT